VLTEQPLSLRMYPRFPEMPMQRLADLQFRTGIVYQPS
jgi:hypothetical protein